jgi:DNA repair protein SbcC/Rad50
MPNSPLSTNRPAEVRAYLTSVLPDARLTDTTVNSAYEPLLLMETRNVMAAFAFANGDIQKSYEALYASFKKHYTAQQGQWDAFDLSFVFCVRPGSAQLDRFCSRVETDVYFCRKFVIPLAAPLGVSLARFPFLPLAPLHEPSIRPPSAQTFLQQCGVPASLAKVIVVQQERSPGGIVEDCTEGEFGEPRPLTTANALIAVQTEPTTAPIKLQSLEIRNFRAYRKPQAFTFGTDATVLYGPNGFGNVALRIKERA